MTVSHNAVQEPRSALHAFPIVHRRRLAIALSGELEAHTTAVGEDHDVVRLRVAEEGVAMTNSRRRIRGKTKRAPVVTIEGRGFSPLCHAGITTKLNWARRESLYKALSQNGNPSFATVLKVARALGVRLHAQAA